MNDLDIEKLNVATELGYIGPELTRFVSRLNGETSEEIRADARALAKLLSPPTEREPNDAELTPAQRLQRRFDKDPEYIASDPLAVTFTDVMSSWLATPFDR